MKTTIIGKIIRPLVLGLLITGIAAAQAATPKNVLVVSVTKGFRHGVIPFGNKILGQIADKSDAFVVDYAKTDEQLAEKTSVKGLAQYDAVIFQNTTGDLPIPNREAFLAWIKNGHGFLGIHAANDTYHGYKPFIDMIGGEFLTHGAQVEVEIINEDPLHPATRMFPKTFKVFDEIYQVKNFYREKVHGLLTLDNHPNSKVPGDYPIAWSKDYGRGRVVYTSPGHREDVWQRADYQAHLLGAIKYILKLEEGNAAPQTNEAILTPEEVAAGFQPLFTGVNLDGWKLRHEDGRQSWSAQNGMLVNNVGDDQHGTDLVSTKKFNDFILRYKYMIPAGANSGVYLRGRYELQILDDFPAKKTSESSNGSFYSFATPSKFASLAPGQWQTVEVTLKGNKVTIILNGVKIHDNLELTRATGGQLDNNLGTPGPIMLQGDHGNVAFKNMRIKELK
ncbi:MAG: ThuA domain-containing protein [Verrucomicrobia bacterium]|nr:ThuA domain-containing protein [Verrucomicrobiota bacterium]MCF7707845.1 ThuA domain-containing protein [Verrucomicrobiota bacterium]